MTYSRRQFLGALGVGAA
ncbi:twin-arginine translocation signal domain-containing protein [Natrinema sp. 1APR25-10V2]|nr:twin-arginine translocation signal domain-containing protein [Natrinema sp. 1APR25-10V2]MDS0474638.1 twin-arginine translocation signal domain-containing protein [Natrinema sp. 1APR25-10V2]